MLVFIDDGYEIKKNSWCSRKPFSLDYPTLSEANLKCSNDPSCTMFYDGGGKGTKFVLCGGTKIISSSKGSRLYIKRSEYVFICTPFWNSSIISIIVNDNVNVYTTINMARNNFCRSNCCN